MSSVDGIETGQQVKLNSKFLEVWFIRDNGYFPTNIGEEELVITSIGFKLCGEIGVWFKDKEGNKYSLYLLSSGVFSNLSRLPGFKGIKVFVSCGEKVVAIAETSGIYCSCGGPRKENWAGGEKFFMCGVCKKEKI